MQQLTWDPKNRFTKLPSFSFMCRVIKFLPTRRFRSSKKFSRDELSLLEASKTKALVGKLLKRMNEEPVEPTIGFEAVANWKIKNTLAMIISLVAETNGLVVNKAAAWADECEKY